MVFTPFAGMAYYFHAETGRVSLINDEMAACRVQRGFRESRSKVGVFSRELGMRLGGSY